MPNVWHVFSFYNSTFAKREVKEVREFKEFIGVKAICFIAKYTTKKAIGYNFFNYYTFRTCETSVNDIYVISSLRKRLSQSFGTAFNPSKYIYYSVLNLNLLLISFRWVYKSRFFYFFSTLRTALSTPAVKSTVKTYVSPSFSSTPSFR